MRCTQIIGLSNSAQDFLRANVATEMRNCGCPTCGELHVEHVFCEVYDSASNVGMFDDGPALYKHKLKDGLWVYEFVQAAPWSSGPCIFLALRREDKTPLQESLWSDEDIRNA